MASKLNWTELGKTWPNGAHSRFVEAGGYRWHVQRAGSGDGLLLLHGTGASTHSWAGLLPLLAEQFEVLAMDLPGHAFTRAAGRADLSLPGMKRSLQALLAAENFKPNIVIGHSAGAALGAALAPSIKPLPECVVAINGALRPFGGAAAWIAPLMAKALSLNPLVIAGLARRGRNPARVARLIAGTGSRPGPRYLEGYRALFSDREHLRATLAMMAAWDVSDLMKPFVEAGLTLHQIIGEADRAVPPEDAERLARRYGGFTLERLSGLGHLAHEEDADRVAEAISRAVPAQDGRRRRAAS
jgi:magnesium chelatase accessory protein